MIDAGERNLELDGKTEGASLDRAQRHARRDGRGARVDAPAATDDAHGALEARAVPEGEELFGIRADACAAQFRRRPDVEIEHAVRGAAMAVATPLDTGFCGVELLQQRSGHTHISD